MGHRDRDWDSMDALRGLLAGMVDALGRLAHTATETARAVRALPRLEIAMASAAEQLTELSAKVDDLVADVRALLAAAAGDRENLSTDGQAAFDSLAAKVDAFDAEVGDADGSDVPPVEGGNGQNV
jgi:hypothetical protein